MYLVDKAYFVLARLVELLVPDQPAGLLYRAGRAGLDREPWQAFLAAANQLLRTNHRTAAEVTAPVDAFAGTVDRLRRAGVPGPVDELLGRLHQARPRAVAFRERVRDDPRAVPTLDPLVPAIVRAVIGWSGDDGEPVTIVHDRQKTLSPDRIAHLTDLLGPRLGGLRFVVARSDPRVQVADILAGVARKLATDELHGRGDPQLTALLRQFLDPFSIWGDDRSWSRLA